MGSRAFTLAEGQNYNQAQPFPVHSVVVDNLTASWLFVQDAVRPVPPFQYGVVLPLPQANAAPVIYWGTPPGLTAPTPGHGTAYITMLDGDLPPSNGQSVVIPSQQVVCAPLAFGSTGQLTGTLTGNAASFQTVPGAPGSGTATLQVTVPAGTNSIILTGTFGYTNFGGVSPSLEVTITGSTTGTIYMDTATAPLPQQPRGPFECVVSPAADPTLSITFTATSIGGNRAITGGNIEVVACFGVTAVAVEGSGSANPVAVNIVQSGSTALPGAGVPILRAPDSALQIANISLVLAAGATSAPIIGPFVTTTAALFTLYLGTTGNGGTAPGLLIQDTTGVTLATLVIPGSGVQALPAAEFDGFEIPAHRGLQINNEDNVAHNVIGYLTYKTF